MRASHALYRPNPIRCAFSYSTKRNQARYALRADSAHAHSALRSPETAAAQNVFAQHQLVHAEVLLALADCMYSSAPLCFLPRRLHLYPMPSPQLIQLIR